MKILNANNVTNFSPTRVCSITIYQKGFIRLSVEMISILKIEHGEFVSVGIDGDELLLIFGDPSGFKIRLHNGYGSFNSLGLVKDLQQILKIRTPYKSARMIVSKEAEKTQGFKSHRVITRSIKIR